MGTIDTLERKYTVTQEDEIVLYGFNLYCRERADDLIADGYNVVGIIDKDTQNRGKNYRGIPIENCIANLVVSEKICVFIMLQNGMLHWDIAFDLYKHGVRRAVFLPMRTGFYSNDVQTDLIIQYNYMIEGNYSLMQVPYLNDEMFEKVREKKWYVARQLDSEECIAWVSTDLVRTALKEPQQYRDIPIADFTPYVYLFLNLSGEKTDLSEYIKIYGKAPFPEESEEAYLYVLNKRRALYEFFEDTFKSGNIDFFVAAAPKAVWNKNGYLNLCEGQHRCVYLSVRGMSHVPVRINKEDIDKLPKDI